jgi:hypothetical protein
VSNVAGRDAASSAVTGGLACEREAEQAAERAKQEAERERMQALEAQTQGLLAFVQQLGEQQGWQIPAQLLAPPRPPRPPR